MSSPERSDYPIDSAEAEVIEAAVDDLLEVAAGMAVAESGRAARHLQAAQAATRARLLRRYALVGFPVGTNLGAKLVASGVSLPSLARSARMPVGVIRQAEKDAYRLKAVTRIKIVYAFNDLVSADQRVTMDELFPPKVSTRRGSRS